MWEKQKECNVLDDDTLIFFSVSWKCSSKLTILAPWSGDQNKLYSEGGRTELISNKHNCTIVLISYRYKNLSNLVFECNEKYLFILKSITFDSRSKSVWDIIEISSKTLVETYEITGIFLFGETSGRLFHQFSIQSPWFCQGFVTYLWIACYICIKKSLTQEESTLSQDISSCTHCSKNLIKQTHAHIRESRADWTPVLLAFDLNFSSPSKHAHF